MWSQAWARIGRQPSQQLLNPLGCSRFSWPRPGEAINYNFACLQREPPLQLVYGSDALFCLR